MSPSLAPGEGAVEWVAVVVFQPASSVGLEARVCERLCRLFDGGGHGAAFSMRYAECYEPLRAHIEPVLQGGLGVRSSYDLNPGAGVCGGSRDIGVAHGAMRVQASGWTHQEP